MIWFILILAAGAAVLGAWLIHRILNHAHRHKFLFDPATGLARHYTFIGRSNHGKSWWSKLFQAFGFKWICIDALIEERLKPTLIAEGYGSGIGALAAWMGMPWDDRYEANQAQYLALEEELTMQAVMTLDPMEPTVIDTTGSVVHLSGLLRAMLMARTKVICLDSTPGRKAEDLALYFRVRKPVALVEFWDPRPGEKDEESLERCYPVHQEWRDGEYHKLAHVDVPYEFHYKTNRTVEEFLDYVQAA